MSNDPAHNAKKLIISDSYFGSYNLGAQLCADFYFLFCVRKNVDRDIKDPFSKGLKKGTWRNIYSHSNAINYCIFNDRTLCSFVSNFKSGEFTVNGVPEIVHLYNTYMNAVDLFDSTVHLNYNTHRNNKWTQSFIYAIMKFCLTNSWIYYCKSKGSAMTSTEFLESIMRSFIMNTPKTVFVGGDVQHLIVVHGVGKLCRWCKTKGKRSNTTFGCKLCDVHLHPKCFAKFHENEK